MPRPGRSCCWSTPRELQDPAARPGRRRVVGAEDPAGRTRHRRQGLPRSPRGPRRDRGRRRGLRHGAAPAPRPREEASLDLRGPRPAVTPPGVASLFTPDRLAERLGEADFVIVTTPETPDTRGMFDSRLFAKMKRGSYFINIARGGCVVTEDLIAALRSGHLAGAGLDVAAPEPLPPDSPLWAMPNVLITPHVAISGAPYRQKWEEILLENCRRFAGNQPLLNVVDKEKWY